MTAWIVLLLTAACAALVALSPPESKTRAALLPWGAGFGVVGIALAALVREPVVQSLGLALAGAGVTVALFDWANGEGLAERGLALGIGTSLLAFGWGWLFANPALLFSVVAGVAAGAAVVAGLGRGATAPGAAALLLAGATASGLGALGPGGAASQAGVVLGFAGVAVTLIAAAAYRAKPFEAWIGTTFVIAAFMGAASVLGYRFFFMAEAAVLPIAGAALSALVAYMAPAQKSSSLTVALAAVAWLGAATLAFSFKQGFGIALLALGGVVTAVMGGNRLALAAVTPALGLAGFRLFRELNPDSVRAFDIGQHYALIGLLLGLALVLVAVEAVRAKGARPVSLALGGLAIAGTVLASIVFLGAKGTLGLFIGLGMGPVVAVLTGHARGGVTAVGVGGMALVAAGTPLLLPAMELGRDGKVQVLFFSGLLIAALAVAAARLGRPTEGKVAT